MDRYDSEIALVDRSVGRLVTALSQLEQPTIFMLTADHGEEFKEHGGNYHGSSLYDEQVRVPLIIGAPGSACGRGAHHDAAARAANPTLHAWTVAGGRAVGPRGSRGDGV